MTYLYHDPTPPIATAVDAPIIMSALKPDYLQDWNLWVETVTDKTTNIVLVRLWSRVTVDSGMPLVVRREPMPGKIPINNGDGTFTVILKDNVALKYNPSRNIPGDEGYTSNWLTFAAGQLNNVHFDTLDGVRDSLNNSQMNITPALTSAYSSFLIDYPGAVSVLVIVAYIDGSTDSYTYSLVD